MKGEITEGVSKAVTDSSSLDTKGKADVVKGIGEAIASNNNISPTEKVTVIESVEKLIASSGAVLEDKKQFTTGLVDVVYKTEPAVKSKLTNAVISGIDKSTDTDDIKFELTSEAQEAALIREEAYFTQSLQGHDLTQNSQGSQIKENLIDATRKTVNAVEELASQIPEPSTKLTEEEIVQKISEFLNNLSTHSINKAHSIRSVLSSGFKSTGEKSTNSEQQINKLIEDYKAIDEKYKPEYEQQQGSYDTAKESQEKNTFIENLKLDDNDKIKLFEKLIKHEGDNKRKGSVENMNVLTNKKTDIENKLAKPGQSSGQVYAAQTVQEPTLRISVPKVSSKNTGITF